MAYGDKKVKVIAYLKKKPDAKNADIAEACGCSVPMISVVKKELGLSGSPGRKKASKKVAKKSATVGTAMDANSIDHVASALEYVDSADALLELLDHVEAAGGIAAVKSALDFHQRLTEAIG